jgi:hypothetical protein
MGLLIPGYPSIIFFSLRGFSLALLSCFTIITVFGKSNKSVVTICGMAVIRPATKPIVKKMCREYKQNRGYQQGCFIYGKDLL